MPDAHVSATRDALVPWALIDAEKQRDRLVRRICVAAWSVTAAVLVVFAILVGAQVAHEARLAAVGAVTWSSVLGSAMPFMVALWVLSLLVATLSTVGVFLRLRTASLSEIQLRLAALEQTISAQPDR